MSGTCLKRKKEEAMNRACFATCLLCCLATFANAKDPSVSFELRTDRNIPYNEWNDVSAVENNVLVAIENGVVVDRFTIKEAERSMPTARWRSCTVRPDTFSRSW